MINRTFSTMKTKVGGEVGDTTTAMLSRIGDYLNDRLREVLRRTKVLDSIRDSYTFTTTAGTEDYLMPGNFKSEISVVDKTNGRELTRIDSQQQAGHYTTELDDQGIVRNYIILDKTVRNQPTSASTLSIASSSASDTTQTVYVKGLDSNGYEDYESVTLNGTSAQVTTKSFSHILTIAKSALTTGTVTITANSGATTVAVLSRAMLDHRIKVMRLVQIPSGTSTIEVNFIQDILPMSQDYDSPILDCAEVIEAGATADGFRYKRQYAKAADWEVLFEKRLANLEFDYASQPNKIQLFNVNPYRRDYDGGNVDDSRRYGVF